MESRENNHVEVLPAGSVELDVSQLTDIEEILVREYRKDILFEIINGLGRKDEIFTDGMKSELNKEKLYSTGDAAALLDEKRSTVSTWVKSCIQYVTPQMDGRNYKLDYEAIFKLRMISMLRQNNQYTITKINEMTSDIEVYDPRIEEKKEKEKPLSSRVKDLEESYKGIDDLNYKLEHLGQAVSVILRGLDEEVLIKLQQGANPSEIIPKFKQDLLPEPAVTEEAVEKMIGQELTKAYEKFSKENEKLKEELEAAKKELDSTRNEQSLANENLREEIKKEIQDEIKRMEEQRETDNDKFREVLDEKFRNQKKGFLQRLFGK